MECKICFENYDHSIHKPNVLIPCSHTLCIDCLSKLKNQTCPLCKRQFTAHNTNWNLLDLVPESDYDRARKSLEESFSQAVDLNKRLKENYTTQTKDTECKFKKIKNQIQTQTSEIIKSVYKRFCLPFYM